MSEDYTRDWRDNTITGASTVADEPTQAFTPTWDEATPASVARHDEPCRCDNHKYGQRPGCDAVLYSGPDAVLLMINAAIRDGRYEDIHAWLDQKRHDDHAKLDAAERQTRRTLAPAIRAWQRFNAARRGVAA